MPLLQQVDPGGEIYLAFARRKLAQIKAQMSAAGVATFARTILADNGTTIYLNSVALGHGLYRDRIRITGRYQIGAAFTCPFRTLVVASINNPAQLPVTSATLSDGTVLATETAFTNVGQYAFVAEVISFPPAPTANVWTGGSRLAMYGNPGTGVIFDHWLNFTVPEDVVNVPILLFTGARNAYVTMGGPPYIFATYSFVMANPSGQGILYTQQFLSLIASYIAEQVAGNLAAAARRIAWFQKQSGLLLTQLQTGPIPTGWATILGQGGSTPLPWFPAALTGSSTVQVAVFSPVLNGVDMGVFGDSIARDPSGNVTATADHLAVYGTATFIYDTANKVFKWKSWTPLKDVHGAVVPSRVVAAPTAPWPAFNALVTYGGVGKTLVATDPFMIAVAKALKPPSS